MGEKRSCIKFAKAKGGVLRCAKFEKGRKYPCEPAGLEGRSQNYIRPQKTKCTAGGAVRAAKKARPAAKKTKKAGKKK